MSTHVTTVPGSQKASGKPLAALVRRALGRLFPDGRRREALACRIEALALAARYDWDRPDAFDAIMEAAITRVSYQRATRDLEEARGARESGRGRRPSASEIRQLAKRRFLERRAWLDAKATLDALAARRRPGGIAALTGRREAAGPAGSPS